MNNSAGLHNIQICMFIFKKTMNGWKGKCMLSMVENNWKSQVSSGTDKGMWIQRSKATMNPVGRKNSKIHIIMKF